MSLLQRLQDRAIRKDISEWEDAESIIAQISEVNSFTPEQNDIFRVLWRLPHLRMSCVVITVKVLSNNNSKIQMAHTVREHLEFFSSHGIVIKYEQDGELVYQLAKRVQHDANNGVFINYCRHGIAR